ncbi:HEXXH motif domain-containing protein [Cryptosporangium aurantiacum]|uniref:HEXXH motif-containing protein n=1 Tax=Cryptosporangium aurantiacum TaxID=134849 RepID=A0A1M7N9Q4_9ACTN|nr:HEXXH motif domain-containing protein [Cryptosporangium aurantiacum]SHM99817.1 HEXXH motif-containing protein [Cryptosporangium aurantiacum]
MHAVSVSPEDLHHLGAGIARIDGALAVGQLSRRLLAIHALLGEVERRAPRLFSEAGTEHARSVLTAVQRRAPKVAEALIRQPQTGGWLLHCLRAVPEKDDADASSFSDDIGYFGAIAAAAAFQAGEAFDVRVRSRADGTVMLPTLGLLLTDAPSAWGSASWAPGDHALAVRVAGSALQVPVNTPGSGFEQWWPLRRLRSQAGGRVIELELDDIDPFRDRQGLGAIGRLTDEQVTRWQAALDAGWELLVRHHGERAAAVSIGVTSLTPIAGADNAAELSATPRESIGAIALTEPATGRSLAEALVHEHQHSVLWALLDLIPVVDEDASQRFYAPWRSDPRPARGLLHGIYAYLGLIDLWQEQRTTDTGPLGQLAQFEFALWRRCVDGAVADLLTSERLSRAGTVFLEGIRSRLGTLLAERVPGPFQEWADRAAEDLRILWRVRNLRANPSAIADLCADWREGRQAGRAVPVEIVPVTQRFAQSPRVRLTRIRLGDPERFAALRGDVASIPGVTPADVLLVLDEPEAALQAYRGADLRMPEAWAGLSVAVLASAHPAGIGLQTAPEIVHAVHECVERCSGSAPDPVTLAAWIGGSQIGVGSKSTAIRSVPVSAASVSG